MCVCVCVCVCVLKKLLQHKCFISLPKKSILCTTLQGSGETFRTRPDRPWGPPSLLYNVYRAFPRGKAAGAWRYIFKH